MDKKRFVCANCGYVFDVNDMEVDIKCPKCGSNACDDYKLIVKKWLESPPIYYLRIK